MSDNKCGCAHSTYHESKGAEQSDHHDSAAAQVSGHTDGHTGGHPGDHVGGHAGGHPGGHPGGHAGGHPGGHPGGHAGGHAGGHPGGHRYPTAPEVSGDPRDVAVNPDEVNARENFSLHSIFKTVRPLPSSDEKIQGMVDSVLGKLKEIGVDVRGWYDVSAYRPDADLMMWLMRVHDEKNLAVDELQQAYRAVVNSELGQYIVPTFSVMEAHLTAEFNTPHLPACFGGWHPRAYCAFYPFNRTFDWYYLPKHRRGAMLKEHGINGRDYNDVAVSTLATFALSDYEWTVSLEADDISRVMGVLRQQRDCEARLFVREDTPFYTGKRVELLEWAGAQLRADEE